MLLVFDIGNTTVAIALFRGDKIIAEAKFLTLKAANIKFATEEIRKLIDSQHIKPQEIEGIAICSVVPSLTAAMAEICQVRFGLKAWIFDYTAKIGMKICYDNPSQLGNDRLANAIAAKTLFGTPVIAVDLGTATKFEVINAAGEYLGGAIAPGIVLSAEGLFNKAAKLFPVDIEKPDKAIATNTSEAMKSGIFYGTIGQIDSLIEKMITELGEKDVKVIATGGLGEKFAPYSKYIQKYDPYLTYQGIRIGFELSR